MTVRLAYRKPPFVLGLAFALALALLAFAAGPAAPRAAASACHEWGNSPPSDLRTGQARKAILCLLNKERDQAGLGDLDRDSKLQKAAQRHNDHMDGTGCFDHACGGESDLDARLQNVGYLIGGLTRWAYGENIAWGMREQGTPRSIVGAWMNSAPHRANILSSSFREIGVGFSAGTPDGSGEPGGIYTTDFGLRVG
ncbi:MAG: hypothetical protein QOI10_1648 [Solirubrobacterales bacterium]|nr:hypothetical protein [Solirubrobacterales bacterium]